MIFWTIDVVVNVCSSFSGILAAGIVERELVSIWESNIKSSLYKIPEALEVDDQVKIVSNASAQDAPSIWSHSDFSNDKKPCHGQYDCMKTSSTRMPLAVLIKKLCRLRNIPIHIVRYLKTQGTIDTMKLALFRALPREGIKRNVQRISVPKQEEVLNLQVGELVEVRPFFEIAKTLDENQRYKGLYFMGGMRHFCGKRFRVLKRVNRILLESTTETRKVTHAVLLKDVVCDGHIWYDCDRSCFYYRREAWLKRVTPSQSTVSENRAMNPSKTDRPFYQREVPLRVTLRDVIGMFFDKVDFLL